MKTSKKIISSFLAVIIVVSAMAIGGFSASAASLKKPTGLKVTNANHSLIIQWKKVSGAKKYQLYRNSKLIKTVASASTRDYAVTGGQTYSYKVRAVNGSKKSSYSSTVKCTRVNATVITSTKNVKAGIEINWVYRTGASKYKVERSVLGASNYTSLGYSTGLSFLDKTAVSGTAYSYRVTGYNTPTKAYSTASVIDNITRIEGVTGVKAIKSGTPANPQITVSWTPSTGAASYNVYRQKITDEDYIKVANITTTTYIDPDIIKNPSAYRYYITAVKGQDESIDSAERFVQTYGSSPAYFDPEHDGGVRNYHVPLAFKVGDVYAEGKALTDYFSYNGNFDVTITEGADVISIDDNVITAKKAGTAKVVIKVTEPVRDIIESVIQDDLVELLTSREIILEITVS